MIIYPDLELRKGRLVNLVGNRIDSPLIYDLDPVQTARDLVAQVVQFRRREYPSIRMPFPALRSRHQRVSRIRQVGQVAPDTNASPRSDRAPIPEAAE